MSNPNPMLIYDLETLEICEVNEAASIKYGYSEEEFCQLTLKDIRPKEDVPLLINNINEIDAGIHEAHRYRHLTKDGCIFYVNMTSQVYPYKDKKCRLVVIHDVSDQVIAEEKAKSAYRQLNHMIHNSPLAMVKWDCNFRIEEWSARSEEITGYKAEEVMGKTPFMFDFVNLKDVFRVTEKMWGLISGRRDQDQLETCIYAKDRSVVDLKLYASAYRNDDGKLQSVLTFTEDLSQQKKAEERYKQLFEGAADGICLVRGNEIVDCNSRLEDIFKSSKKDIIGKTPICFSPEIQPDGKNSKKTGLRKIQLALKGKTQTFEWKHKTTAGKLIDTEISLKRIEISEEVYIQAIIRDITQQKEIERKVELRGEMFSQLFQNSPIGIVMMDEQDKVMMINASFEKMFGYSLEDLEGHNIDDFIVEPEFKEEASRITRGTHKGEQFNTESVRIRKDGNSIDVIIGSVPVYNNGSQVAIYGMYVDISERKESEELLKHSLKEKEILLAEVHHRVKNNLAIVSGLLQLQTFGVEDDDELRKHLQASQLRIHSMAIVHEMLYQSETLSEVAARNYIAKLTEVIESTLSPEQKEIKIIADTDDIILNVNQAIPCALIINELITNAYEYAFEGRGEGKIYVNVHQKGSNIEAEVRDNGIGLPGDFDNKKKNSLGIYLVNTLGQQLETDINIDSGDWGTSFFFSFTKTDKPGSSSSYRINKNGVQREEIMAEMD